ncbi:MAG TPA: hypothetical protein VF503_14055 [Sphingobium sp.]|uniref:LVIVD repeat-containing protein n=1 Tax=Sphingobium sp. TaxID=1912891 RepID=UPI002ED1696C
MTTARLFAHRNRAGVDARTFLTAALLAWTLQPALASAVDTPDRPEPGKQGETIAGEEHVLPTPYSMGVDVIGHNPIDKRVGNLAMAWSGRCAYVASGVSLGSDGSLKMMPHVATSGVAVIDVANPAAPRLVRYLQDKGSIDATETVHAVTIKGRALLAASNYGGVEGMSAPPEGWLSIHDVSDCANPRLLAEVKWPEPVHTLTISPDARFVYGTVLNPFTGEGGIEIMDIADPTKPKFLGKFAATRKDGTSFAFAPHELVFSPDARRIYVGVVSSRGGDLIPDAAAAKRGPPSAASVGRDAGGVYIFDNSDFVTHKTDPKLRLIGTALHAGWHSPVRATIGGKPYIVNAGELGACPGAWPRITTIANENDPRVVGEFQLAMNRPENCPAPNAMETATGGMVGRAGVATTHFNDVDSAADTRLGLFGFTYAGLRIVDLRNPTAPKEIAYFKPGDPCMSHVRYMPRTGHIWFACNASGFYVIRVKPALRAKLGLPKVR